MIELSAKNVVDFLRDTGRLPRDVPARAELLAWGVSNMVFRVTPATGEDFVVKQSRTQLRTKAPWFSRLERIHTEMDLMKHLAGKVPAGAIPRVLFEDRDNFLFGMEAVAADHRVWKADLLAGASDPTIADEAGKLLAAIHRETAGRTELNDRFGDRTVFDELRVDPFYRFIMEKHPHLGPALERVIDEVLSLAISVVHADFSPKNLLLAEGRLILVDFETGHFGDPAFDLGFFLSHLWLKTIKHARAPAPFLALARRFWETYWKHLEPPGELFERVELERRTVGNLAGCLLARIDGKSPIDYFDEPWQSETARSLVCTYLMRPVTRIAHAFEEIEKNLADRQLPR
jgi:5-methylthioribose kinase